ncbi:unnamed protein product [Ranitomeya imitator]|uniref:Uncharacterized protein n=1 Tax=Ranitomeya imitator TaxID=111125 RepID=A0ABN9LR16_9NEOB|nr:unnamed protein product [Ranitomeya imitator]
MYAILEQPIEGAYCCARCEHVVHLETQILTLNVQLATRRSIDNMERSLLLTEQTLNGTDEGGDGGMELQDNEVASWATVRKRGQMPDLAITRVQRPFEDQAHAGYLTKVIANSMASVNTNMSAQFAEDPILQLNVHKLPKKQITVRQPPLAKLTTPVNVKRMGPWLDKYPNKSAMAQLRFGFSFGFFIPFNFLHEPQLAPNLKSARESPGILSDKLNKEIKLGRFKGPFKTHPFSNL